MPRFSVWTQTVLTKVTSLASDDAFALATATPEAKAIERDDLVADIASDVLDELPLTTNGDLLTQAAGARARITRADLADDTAWTSKYVESQLSETPKIGDLLVVQSLSPLVLEPIDALQIAMLNTDLVLLVDTTAPSATTTVTLPLAGTVDVYVDWGDGSSDTYTTSGNKTHTYAAAGQYRIRIEGSLTAFGANVSRPELVGCASFGRLGITSIERGFRLCANFVQVPSRSPSAVTNMSSLFSDALAFNQDIGGWDTGNVTNMSAMFGTALAFNQDIGGWDTGNVTNMSFMFFDAIAFNQDIGGWDTGNVTTFREMFKAVGGRVMTFNQDIGGWDVRKATTMLDMLRSPDFEQDIGDWRPQRCTTFASFLAGVTLNPANYDALLTGWTDFDGTGWDTGSITAVADATGGVCTVTTSAAHGLPNNHVMRISGTTSYDGYYKISGVTATTFNITATFVATETGTWQATLMADCVFSGGNSKYNPAGLVGRNVLTGAPFNWTITDGGAV